MQRELTWAKEARKIGTPASTCGGNNKKRIEKKEKKMKTKN